SEYLKEKESFEKKISILKDDLQREESKNIDRELPLEKEVKELNNIVFKRNQSAQTVHMLKAQQLKPNLYDGSVIGKSDVIVVPDSENTLMHAEEMQTDEPTHSGTTIVEVPKELPKVSMVNSCLKKLKYHLASFDIVVKERTTATTITEGTWGFEHTKACFRDDIIPFVKNLKDLFTSFDQYLIDERDNVSSSESAPTFAELFETNELKAQIQEKDTVILKLKEKIKSLRADDKERKVESKVEDIDTQNLELDHRVTKLTAENNHLKQTYK
nr:hypothetical protein [Tanacetum cinerariifolium]